MAQWICLSNLRIYRSKGAPEYGSSIIWKVETVHEPKLSASVRAPREIDVVGYGERLSDIFVRAESLAGITVATHPSCY